MTRFKNLLGKQIPILQRPGLISLLSERLFPLLYLAGVLLLDHAIPSTTIAPPLCSLGLMGMSFFLVPQWMMLWGILYSFVIIGAFFNPTLYQFLNHASLLPHAIPPSFFARSFAFTATALFCTLFSLTLSRFRKSHDEILQILSRFPRPIITSNLTGEILFCNDKAKKLLSLQDNIQTGLSYFDLFSPRDKKGLLIAKYLQQIDYGDSEKTLSLEYQGKPLLGETILLDSTGEKILVTVLVEK